MTPQDARYATPVAMRRALTDKLRSQAKPNGPWQLLDLQRQFAYDRLLDRLYRTSSRWIVKGATALLARHIAVRHTIDIDLYRAGAIIDAERDVRTAAELDLGDWMKFTIGNAHTVAAGVGNGLRLPVQATIGTTQWSAFHVDLVGDGIQMTGTPDEVPPLVQITLPGVDAPAPYLAYPLVDHVADKTCAILERHGPALRPSARYKDLVDLVALITSIEISSRAQAIALSTEAARRSLLLPDQFEVPDRSAWETGYSAAIRRSVGATARTLDEALSTVKPFLDPLLQQSADGIWSASNGKWERPS